MLHEWIRLAVDVLGLLALTVFGTTVAVLGFASRAQLKRLRAAEIRCPELNARHDTRCELHTGHAGPCLTHYGLAELWWEPRRKEPPPKALEPYAGASKADMLEAQHNQLIRAQYRNRY